MKLLNTLFGHFDLLNFLIMQSHQPWQCFAVSLIGEEEIFKKVQKLGFYGKFFENTLFFLKKMQKAPQAPLRRLMTIIFS